MTKRQQKLDLLRRALGEREYSDLLGLQSETDEEKSITPKTFSTNITDIEVDMISTLIDKIGQPNCDSDPRYEIGGPKSLSMSHKEDLKVQSAELPRKGKVLLGDIFKYAGGSNACFDNIGAEHPAIILKVLEASLPNRKSDLLRSIDGPTARAVIRLARNGSTAAR